MNREEIPQSYKRKKPIVRHMSNRAKEVAAPLGAARIGHVQKNLERSARDPNVQLDTEQLLERLRKELKIIPEDNSTEK